MDLLVRSQVPLAEKGGQKWIDDCGPASVAMAVGWATGYTITPTAKQGWTAAAQAGRNDRPDQGDGTSAKQVIDACKVLGTNARWAKSWDEAATAAKNKGSALIVNIQASEACVPPHLRSTWQVASWRRQPGHTYGHWIVLTHDGTGWLYACPTMVDGEVGRRATTQEVKALRESKRAAARVTVIVTKKGIK